MENTEIYSTEEIIEVTEKVVETILKESGSMISYIVKADWFHKGPLSWFVFYSKRYNSRGKYAIDIEELTMKQKAIVSNLVGKTIPKLGSMGEKNEFKISNYSDPILRDEIRNDRYSPSEYKEMKEQGMIDTIIRAINSRS